MAGNPISASQRLVTNRAGTARTAPTAVRVIYSVSILAGTWFILLLSVPNQQSPNHGEESFIAILMTLIPIAAFVAARAWADPAIFLTFGSVGSAFILVPWLLGGDRSASSTFMYELLNLILLLAAVLGIGLLCRFIAWAKVS